MSSTKLSKLAETLIGSEIVKLGADIKAKINQGRKIFNYTIGDFDSSVFPIPPELENGIIEAYKNRLTTYPPAEGVLELRETVAEFIRSREGISFGTDEILIAAGGRPLLYAAYRAIVDKGDKVIYPVPSWNNNHYVHFTEGKHIAIETTMENHFMPTAAEIRPHIQDTSLLALCSPLNPTGTTFTRSALEDICDLVLEENGRRSVGEKKLYLLYDQIYWTLTYGEVNHYNPVSLRPAMKPYTIFIDGISKAFASTGVRVGWAMGPTHLIAKMRAINSHIGAWAPMAEQNGTARFLQQKGAVDVFLKGFKSALVDRLNSIYKGIQQLKKDGFAVDAIHPQAAIYLTIQFNLVGKKTPGGQTLASQPDVTSYLLNEACLAIVPFSAFGTSPASTWYRLSVGTCKKEEINEMLMLLKQSLERLI